MPDGGTVDDDYRVLEKLKKLNKLKNFNSSETFSSKISIDDGYVEYSYDFDIGGSHSIHTLLGMICAVFGVTNPPHGEIRDRNTYTLDEIQTSFFNHDTDGLESSCEDYELKLKSWKSFKHKLNHEQ